MGRRFVVALLAGVCFAPGATPGHGAGATPLALPRVQQSALQYLGAFLLPEGTYGSSRFGYGGAAPVYYKDDADRETMFMEGHAWYKGNVAQILIPRIVSSRDLDELERATFSSRSTTSPTGSSADATGTASAPCGCTTES